MLTVIALLLVGASPAAARSLLDSQLREIPNTLSDTTTSQLAAGPTVLTTRAEPELDFQASLGSTASPEDDLAAALDALSRAGDDVAAQAAIGRATAILDGSGAPAVSDDRAYQGMPLLNWNMVQRVKTVHNGEGEDGNVDVREVRFGDHALLDTWLLRFTDPTRPFKITWHVTELGTSFGGQLAPAALLTDGSTQVGQHSLLKPLVRGGMSTGTTARSRFHPSVDPGVPNEETRLATQTLTVRMPPAGLVNAILDPNLKPGHETFAQLLPADDGSLDRLAMAEQQLGTDKATAISRLAPQAPESQIYRELGSLLGAEGQLVVTPEAAAAKAAELRPLVAAMRSRDSLPSGVGGDPAADVNVVLMNNEAYVSRRSVRVAPGASVKVAVTNLDGFDHRFKAVELKDRDARLGADDWGAFTWGDAGFEPVPAGESRTLTVEPSASAFTLWVGDPDLGDQSGMAVKLDRGPRVQSLKLGEAGSLPLHQALDADGRVWVTMEGSDELVRLSPGDDAISTAAPERFPLPGGLKDPARPPAAGQTEALLGPSDVAIDGQGMVWTTLLAGNAIARLDPSRIEAGTTKGIEIFPLQPCDSFCRRPAPPVVPGPLSREPLQMRLVEDGGGNTVVWFTEMAADRIGVIRVTPAGEKIDETHFTCGCKMPLGIALDGDGRVWFSEGIDNRIGRLTLDTTRPYRTSTMTLHHFRIPSSVEEFTPGQPRCAGDACVLPNPAITSLPHSVQIDPRGRVWFTEEATEKVGYLDPARAVPNTTQGMEEVDGPENDFKRSLAPADIAFDRAGTAFISDEYGDQIASATVRDNGSIAIRTAFRPTERNSFTDAPMVDDRGDLWFVESGADSITRVDGVSAGVARPARTALLTADVTAGTLRAEGLREMASADVRVLRGSTEVDRADDVPVAGGAFSVALTMEADDRVEVTPQGEHAPRPFAFAVADLRASVGADGTLGGLALSHGDPLADRVTVTVGAASATAAIGAEQGAFTWGEGLDAATTGGTLSWTAGTVAARFRTVTAFGAAGTPAEPGPGTTPSPAPGTTTTTPAPAVKPATPAAKKPTPARKVEAARCPSTRWLTRAAGRATTLPLLGLGADAARTCLGRPPRVARDGRATLWTWPGRLQLRLEGDRVTAFTLLGPSLRSAPDRAAVGARIGAFRRALGRVTRDEAGDWRGLVRVGSGRYADVRMRLGTGGSVARVTVTTRPASRLDRAARSLLRGAP